MSISYFFGKKNGLDDSEPTQTSFPVSLFTVSSEIFLSPHLPLPNNLNFPFNQRSQNSILNSHFFLRESPRCSLLGIETAPSSTWSNASAFWLLPRSWVKPVYRWSTIELPQSTRSSSPFIQIPSVCFNAVNPSCLLRLKI